MLVEQEREFPYWFAVSDLEPDYGEEICFSCGGTRKTFEKLLAIALDHEGFIEISELDDPIPGSSDDDYEGIYFHLLQMRFKLPQKRSAAFHSLASVGFLVRNSAAFRAGQYPQSVGAARV